MFVNASAAYFPPTFYYYPFQQPTTLYVPPKQNKYKRKVIPTPPPLIIDQILLVSSCSDAKLVASFLHSSSKFKIASWQSRSQLNQKILTWLLQFGTAAVPSNYFSSIIYHDFSRWSQVQLNELAKACFLTQSGLLFRRFSQWIDPFLNFVNRFNCSSLQDVLHLLHMIFTSAIECCSCNEIENIVMINAQELARLNANCTKLLWKTENAEETILSHCVSGVIRCIQNKIAKIVGEEEMMHPCVCMHSKALFQLKEDEIKQKNDAVVTTAENLITFPQILPCIHIFSEHKPCEGFCFFSHKIFPYDVEESELFGKHISTATWHALPPISAQYFSIVRANSSEALGVFGIRYSHHIFDILEAEAQFHAANLNPIVRIEIPKRKNLLQSELTKANFVNVMIVAKTKQILNGYLKSLEQFVLEAFLH
jgi:hypothetical protein